MSTPQPMEIEATTQGQKRAIISVDPDTGDILPSSKKAKIIPNKTRKLKCLKFILNCYEKMHDKILGDAVDPTYSNINISIAVTNIVFSCFTCKRQSANGTGGNTEAKAREKKNFSVHTMQRTYTISVDDALKIVTEEAATQGLEFKKYNRGEDSWYGTVMPYLDFFGGFGLRMNELRMGHGDFPNGKSAEGMTKAFPVSKYGISGMHHILLEGCTYAPEKKFAMAQSLGPLTVLLLHIRTGNKTYREKWTSACKRMMSHIPYIDEILGLIAGKEASEVSTVVQLIADLLCMVSSRQAHRMFFSTNMIYKVWKLPTNDAGFITVDETVTTCKGGDFILENFNVSGNGGFYAYRLMNGMGFEIEGNWNELHAAQVAFHCIMGTYCEDLSILESITNLGTWNTREEIGTSFQKMTNTGRKVVFALPILYYYSKLASANQTKLLTSSYSQQSVVTVFSGFRSQGFTDAFFESLNRGVNVNMSSKTIPTIIGILTDCIQEIREEIFRRGNRLEIGNVQWRSMEDIEPVGGGSKTDFRAAGNCKFFLGKK